jgi:hypothetical protein
MRLTRALTAAFAVVVLCATSSFAQQQTGTILGRVTDSSGSVLPGVTVTIAGPALLAPRVIVASETGTYRAPELPIGTYSVTFELTGFNKVVREEVRLTIGFTAQVNAELAISTLQETVTVTGESPLIDTKETGTKTAFDLEQLQNLPSARDPWVMLERTPGIIMDRVNVGGNQSGQQSGFISRGAASGNNKWSIDGVDVTDMSATGASPGYYDFDMLAEMQVTTGGADASQQTGGVGINLVTRSGTDIFRGSSRFYLTDEAVEDDNITDELRAQGAGSGAPIQNIKDYGIEAGGPLKKGRLWLWGSYGKQNVRVGVVGFYKDNPTCRPTPPTDTEGLRDCLESDLTTLNNYNYKLDWAMFQGNKLTFQNSYAEKVRNARDGSDIRPIETTYRQIAVDSSFGARGWNTGPNPFWKLADQHVFNDRWLVDVTWAHNGNNFALDFHEDSLADVQPALETTTGAYSRSYQGSFNVRPTNSVDVVSNYFMPAFLGGDHAFKAGVRWRTAHQVSGSQWGGNAVARFTNGLPNSADLYRNAGSEYHLDTWGLFAQDAYTVNRLTLNLGIRLDIQSNKALASSVPANRIAPDRLPAIDFPGIDGPVTYKNVSPRIGMTYDLTGEGRTILSASYSMYYGQLSPDELTEELLSIGSINLRYPWNDANGDRFVQANELDFSNLLFRTNTFDPANPTNFRSPGTVDPNIRNDRTREAIVGFDHQLFGNIAVGASYVWRKYDDFNWRDRVDFGVDNMRAVTFTPSSCPAGARCETVTYYEPTVQVPAAFVRTNTPDQYRNYNGAELTVQKRMSNRWSGILSYGYNNAVDNWTLNSVEDPTPRTSLGFEDRTFINGSMQYAPEATGSGIGNVFQNAKWMVKAGGQVLAPLGIGIAANYQIRQGFPNTPSIQTPNRANGAGQILVLLDPLGDERLDNLQTLDVKVDRRFSFGRVTLKPQVDFFNLGNVNTVLARRRNQAASNANTISGIVAPRVVRFGLGLVW